MVLTQQTLRVAGLPSKTEPRDVENFFTDQIKRKNHRQIVESVGPICTHASRVTKRTTVSFSSSNTAQKALDLKEPSRRFHAEKGGAETVTVDAAFLDLTTLHSSANPATGQPDIDIVALHGLTGHGWNSFTTSSMVDKGKGRTKETNWLRDILPRLLEQNQHQHIYPRVMTYGYDADVWMTRNVADIDVPVNNLLSYLDTERSEDPGRPLFFIGHSLGGIVIKQAIVALANDALKKNLQEPQSSTKGYNFPVKGCMFFGVPNRGAELAATASSILTLLNKVFNVNKNVVQDLHSKSQQLANLASQFREVRNQHDIPVISFFETEKFSNALGLIVDKDSAVIEYPDSPRPFGINRNHKEMIKFANDDTHALEPAIGFLAQYARVAVNGRQYRLPSPSQPASPVEDRYSILSDYDTVFLVDDSPSMAGERWDLVRKILDYSTAIATRYGGVDVHFLNNKQANQDNIKDHAIAVQVHQDIVLKGSTPLLDQLSRHLNSYLRKLRESSARDINFKGYHLIIITDGEPNEEFESPSDISDTEDARINSPAYRLIRKEIIRVARRLDQNQESRKQVGIQFCQIGNDDGAVKFFRYLDDNLKGTYKLGRDMVDTIRCNSEAHLTELFFSKLLLGAIDKAIDHQELSVTSSEGHPWSAEEPRGERSYRGNYHSDPQTPTLQSFHEARRSTYSQQYQHQGTQPFGDTQYQPPPRQILRYSTTPHGAAELPIRGAMRSSTIGQQPSTRGWRPFS
ncbi:hypothetical protein MMC07_008512 [Pseudocyphellaria aurata]|nr:hypothetical protein [Pseudocyphellaria aurata]